MLEQISEGGCRSFEMFASEGAGALFSGRAKTAKQTQTVSRISYVLLCAQQCMPELLCSALLSFMDSRAAGWVGRGRREDAAGDDGISLFDLI